MPVRCLSRAGPEHPEDGSGTVLGLGLTALVLVLLVTVLALAQATHARGQAQTAADLAALAAAEVLLVTDRPGPACQVAAQVMQGNDAQALGCQVTGAVVTVRAAVPVDLPGTPRAYARARAGPVDGGTGTRPG